MHIEELAASIQPLSKEIISAAQKRFDNLINPSVPWHNWKA